MRQYTVLVNNYNIKTSGSTFLEDSDRLTNQPDRAFRKLFERLLKNSARQNITVFLCRWLIDRLTDGDYSRWRSRLVDRLLIACERETGGNSHV